MSVENETPSAFTLSLLSQNPGWRVCTLSTPCPLKDSGGGGGLRKLAQGICPQNGFRLLDSTGAQVGHFEKERIPKLDFLTATRLHTRSESRIKTFWSHRGPRGTALGCSGGSEVSTQTREPTRKERKTRCLRGDRKGTPR